MVHPLDSGRAGLSVTGRLTRATLRAAFAVRPNRTRAARAARIVLCIAGPLAVGTALGDPQVGLIAALGGFAGVHGHDVPYRQRARLVGLLGLAHVAAVLVGTAATQSPIVFIVGPGLFALAAAFAAQALSLPAPREFMLILVCLLTGALPAPLAGAPATLGLAAAGATWAWIVLMAGWLVDRERPERVAVQQAIWAVIDLLERRGRIGRRRRHEAVLTVRDARRTVEFASGPTAPELRGIQLETESLLDRALGTVPSTGPHGLPPATRELRIVTDLSLPAPDDLPALIDRAETQLARTALALPLRGLRRGSPVRGGGRGALRSGLWSLRNALGRHSLALPTAGRIGIAVSLGLLLGELSGAPRPYWIALSAAAVLQGSTLTMAAQRSVERALGTLVGVLLGLMLALVDPPVAVQVLGVAAAMFLAHLVVAQSYAVAVVFFTPMTFLLAELGSGGVLSTELIAWRLGDTVIGCLLGYAAGRLLWPHDARVRLDQVLLVALDATAAVLDPDGDSRERRAGRHRLRVALLNLRAVSDAGLGDRLTASPTDDELWPLVAATEQLGYRTLAAADEQADDEGPTLRAELTALTDELARRADEREDPRWRRAAAALRF